jgi:hypothetical protein
MAAATERVPAWKRMGLTLKNGSGAAGEKEQAAAGSGSSAVGPVVGHPSRTPSRTTTTNDTNDSTTPARPWQSHKRKLDPPPSETDINASSPNSHVHNNSTSTISKSKKQRRDSSSPQTPKKVTFEEPSKTPKSAHSKQHSKPVVNQATKKPAKGKYTAKSPKSQKQKQQPPADVQPSLAYLRQWKTSRESWKFNKNHQSTLIRHAFEPHVFPADDIDAFYEYIRDLRGFVRTRLRETAMEIKMRDVEDGYAAFPESDDAMDLDEQQTNYESILVDILRRRRQNATAAKRKYFAEAQYVAESADGNSIIVRRLIKRMRAEMVLDELSDGESTDSSTGSTASSKTMVASDNTNASSSTNASVTGAEQTTRGELGDVSGKRRRKLRVNMDDTSSSESSSESESDSDSSSSSDDEDSDEDEEMRPDNYDTSSSSSSSSSGESDSEEDSSDDDDDD